MSNYRTEIEKIAATSDEVMAQIYADGVFASLQACNAPIPAGDPEALQALVKAAFALQNREAARMQSQQQDLAAMYKHACAQLLGESQGPAISPATYTRQDEAYLLKVAEENPIVNQAANFTQAMFNSGNYGKGG